MRAIEVTINVLLDGTVELEGPADLPAGQYQALLVVDRPAIPRAEQATKPPLELTMLDWSAWPSGSTFRREDIYGAKTGGVVREDEQVDHL